MTTRVLRPGTTSRVMQRVFPKPHPRMLDPVGYAEDLGLFMWSKQREVLEALARYRKVAVHSCHNTGKSFDAGFAAAWWIATRPIGQAFVATTAPSYPQVHAILWEEIRKQHREHGLPGRVLQSDEWKVDVPGADEESALLLGYGRKPADADEHGFQGIHRKYVLGILDEACGIPPALWVGMEAITTNRFSKLLAIGNPDDPQSKFEEVCGEDSGWHVIHIGYEDTPAYTGEVVPEELEDLLLDEEWVEDKKKSWGEDSPLFISKCKGLFPSDAEDGVILNSDLQKCLIERDYHNEEWETRGQGVTLGVDVGGGGDRTVIVLREGPRFQIVHEDRVPDTMHTVDKVMEAIRKYRPQRVNVDEIGIGRGVIDRLHERKVYEDDPDLQDVELTGVNVGKQAKDPKSYPNIRSEMWWEARTAIEKQRWHLSLMPASCVQELLDPKYRILGSKTIVEKKDETKKRLGRSPDQADALLLAAYDPPEAGGAIQTDTRPDKGGKVVRRGDLKLKGKKYQDKPRGKRR